LKRIFFSTTGSRCHCVRSTVITARRWPNEGQTTSRRTRKPTNANQFPSTDPQDCYRTPQSFIFIIYTSQIRNIKSIFTFETKTNGTFCFIVNGKLDVLPSSKVSGFQVYSGEYQNKSKVFGLTFTTGLVHVGYMPHTSWKNIPILQSKFLSLILQDDYILYYCDCGVLSLVNANQSVILFFVNNFFFSLRDFARPRLLEENV